MKTKLFDKRPLRFGRGDRKLSFRPERSGVEKSPLLFELEITASPTAPPNDFQKTSLRGVEMTKQSHI